MAYKVIQGRILLSPQSFVSDHSYLGSQALSHSFNRHTNPWTLFPEFISASLTDYLSLDFTLCRVTMTQHLKSTVDQTFPPSPPFFTYR